MGKTSKFSFPIPGRKYAGTEELETWAQSPAVSQRGLSKAQRILGTEGLNIDSPTKAEDHFWRYPSPRSSDMSISISESTQTTQSTTRTGSFQASATERSDQGSGMVPKSRLRGKPSSTVLGQKFSDGETDNSSTGRRVTHEDSSSTLKSYYDRQKSPLSISQQTSASSARDLALRKGLPQVVLDLSMSPRLQIVASSKDFEETFVDSVIFEGKQSRENTPKKKPPRLDFSTLFPTLSKRSNGKSPTPLSTSTNEPRTPESLRPGSNERRLHKNPSIECLRLERPAIRPTESHESLHQGTQDSPSNAYDTYEELVLSQHLSEILESKAANQKPQTPNNEDHRDGQRKIESSWALKAPDIPPRSTSDRLCHNSQAQAQPRRKDHPRSRSDQSATDHVAGSDDHEPFSWKQVQDSKVNQPGGSSAASISSKTSRMTNASTFLASDSEDEEQEDQAHIMYPTESSNEKALRVMNGKSEKLVEARRQQPRQPEQTSSRRQSTRKGAAQVSPFLPIPEASAINSRLFGPWVSPKADESKPTDRPEEKQERHAKKSASSSSKHSSNHSSLSIAPSQPPLRQVPDSSRFMALTEQEAALVAALRTKKAKMRQKIIEEHETAKSPPAEADKKVSKKSFSKASSSSKPELEPREEKEKILLYLDMPLNERHTINTAEPSRDLSDHLSGGSDGEESTPRTSYIEQKKGKPRPDSIFVSPVDPTIQGMSPSTSARLSAVGASAELRKERPSQGSRRSANSGTRHPGSSKGNRGKMSC